MFVSHSDSELVRLDKPTVKRHKKSDGSIRRPLLDLTDVRSQSGVVHSAVEHLSAGRQGPHW